MIRITAHQVALPGGDAAFSGAVLTRDEIGEDLAADLVSQGVAEWTEARPAEPEPEAEPAKGEKRRK
ncbi:MAG: hypothetical protein MH204_08105 [Fimbriimonadaceae bacterium]|nr:hypothetical protein [Fimbriimonadaceae bacterium]